MLDEMILKRDQGSEKRLIGFIIVNKSIPEGVNADWFCGEERILFDGLDRQLNKLGEIDAVFMKEFNFLIEDCLSTDCSFTGIMKKSLSDCMKEREFARIVLRNSEDQELNIDEKLENTCQKLNELQMDGNISDYDPLAVLRKLIEVADDAQKNRYKIRGLSTGIPTLDSVVGGIELGKVYVIGALKKTGKSRFMINLINQIAKLGNFVMINSLEMSAEQLTILMICHIAEIDSSLYGTSMPKSMFEKLAESYGVISNYPWAIHSCYTVRDLRSRVFSLKKKKDLKVVFVDYLQRMQNTMYKADKTREMESISIALANMAKELNVAVIELSQLQNDAEKLDKKVIPDMRHYKESGGIAESADAILTLHDPNRHEENFESNKNKEFMLKVEQRYNISGKVINLYADLSTCRYFEKSERTDTPYGNPGTTF